MRKIRPTDQEFAELARKRDEEIQQSVARICEEQGWNPAEVKLHVSHRNACYCACPDGALPAHLGRPGRDRRQLFQFDLLALRNQRDFS